MSLTETGMLDQPSKDTEKSTPGWRFPKLLGYGEAPGAGPGKGKTESSTPKEPEERKHQFATWYIFAAFLGVLLVQFLLLRFTQVDTIPYSQFEQLVGENKIAEVLVGQETVQGILKEPFPDGRKMFYTVRVEPGLADKLRGHGVVITGAPSSTFLSTILSWVLPIFIFYLIWIYGFRRVAERQGLGGLMSIGKSRAKVYVETDTKTTFRDVAGADEAKFELQEVVAFLRDPTSFGRLGARIPKGILLVGPPARARRCWRARWPARRACHSSRSPAPSSSRCSSASAQHACAICSSRRATLRPASSSSMSSMRSAAAAVPALSAATTRRSRRSISCLPNSTASTRRWA
jgi:cell division protease FtsH